jgi:ribosomal protein L40E
MIRCGKCGALNEAEASFCAECNAYLEWSGEKVGEEVEQAKPEPGPPPTGPETPSSETVPAARPTTPVSPEAQEPARAPDQPGARRPAEAEEQPRSRKPSKTDAAGSKPKAAPAKPAKSETPKPGERICPECGAGNDPQRKFCRRCGHSLAEAQVATEPAPPKAPWYRRLRGGRKEPQTYEAGSRPASMGVRRWRPGCMSVVVIILLVIGIGSVLSYLYVPSVTTVVDDFIGAVRNRVEGVGTVNPIATTGRSVTAHPAAHATDGDPETYWLGVPGEQDRWRLKMRFERPTALRQVDIQPGASGDRYREHGRPRVIRVRAGEIASQDFTLDDDGETQTVTLDLPATTEAWLIVLDTYGGTEAADDVAIREVVLGASR